MSIEYVFLGITHKDRQSLIDNVDIIYNCAASVRFDDPLDKAIFTNVRSTRELLLLAEEMKHLKAFIHVSTAYCNSDKQNKYVIEEEIYPSRGDWREAIDLIEQGDKNITDILSHKYIHPHVNTYTYAKSLGEHVVKDLCYGKIAAAIVRPSIGMESVQINPVNLDIW